MKFLPTLSKRILSKYHYELSQTKTICFKPGLYMIVCLFVAFYFALLCFCFVVDYSVCFVLFFSVCFVFVVYIFFMFCWFVFLFFRVFFFVFVLCFSYVRLFLLFVTLVLLMEGYINVIV